MLGVYFGDGEVDVGGLGGEVVDADAVAGAREAEGDGFASAVLLLFRNGEGSRSWRRRGGLHSATGAGDDGRAGWGGGVAVSIPIPVPKLHMPVGAICTIHDLI